MPVRHLRRPLPLLRDLPVQGVPVASPGGPRHVDRPGTAAPPPPGHRTTAGHTVTAHQPADTGGQ
ncbi:hypothetical protein [Streptomyces coeruleorubidus]|uniref:Uncharacterized protein n=1 Tax=Streptomyces coeruleorubidus TaxID=116188 RepID=A0ABZ0KCS1_STRC4|nr:MULTISPECIES: hypothetical protein [Streptomyces]WOT35446.1 hypothetical protein R5U08_15485 [Streptomyces coeruleorubidus]